MKHKNLLLLFLTAMILSVSSMTYAQKSGSTWSTPEKYQKMKNPLKSDAASVAEGKTVWAKHCKSCHGSKGLGDGPKAASLKTNPGDFSKAAFKNLPDGAIYYRSFVGRDEMPNFEKKIVEENERWALLNFMRSL